MGSFLLLLSPSTWLRFGRLKYRHFCDWIILITIILSRGSSVRDLPIYLKLVWELFDPSIDLLSNRRLPMLVAHIRFAFLTQNISDNRAILFRRGSTLIQIIATSNRSLSSLELLSSSLFYRFVATVRASQLILIHALYKFAKAVLCIAWVRLAIHSLHIKAKRLLTWTDVNARSYSLRHRRGSSERCELHFPL